MLVSRILLGLAVVLLGAAVVAMLWPQRPATEPAMTVDPLDVDLVVPTGQPHILTVTVSNPADRPRRIIGLAEG
jgi:hypothetical protein